MPGFSSPSRTDNVKILLVAVVLIGLGAVAGAVVVGIISFDGTVVENPYERGISWDTERVRREASGIRIRIVSTAFRVGANTLVFQAFGDGGEPVADKRLAVRLSRAETDEHDRIYTAIGRGDGTFTFDLDLTLPGRWEMAILVERRGAVLEFPASIYAGDAL